MKEIRVVIYKDKNGEWRWRAKAGNNRTIADSGESYRNRQDAVDAVRLLTEAPVEFEEEKPRG